MSRTILMIRDALNWVAAKGVSLGYLLPDQLELVLYVGLAVYFGILILQQQA
ncbi:MAG: hypothetical protein WB661_09600 [Candidatus Bathyarchaeia archaeon]